MSYFLISPFAAVRRLIGIMLAATLVLGRSAAIAPAPRRRTRNLLWCLAAFNAAAGVAIFGVDWQDAELARTAAVEAATLIRDQDPNAVIWSVGGWGFQYNAEQLGMRPSTPIKRCWCWRMARDSAAKCQFQYRPRRLECLGVFQAD